MRLVALHYGYDHVLMFRNLVGCHEG
jgi:hypothetical protein